VPKEVDHPARRRELADAACRVIARNGLSGTTLAHVADESGWSIGSIRYYFPNKDELVASALWRVGERVDERIRRRTAGGMTVNDLRIAATELLPLDANGRQEALVHLAFMAQAAVVPALADAAEDAARRLQEPLAARIAYAVEAGELPAHLDAEDEAARLRVLLDGLAIQLVTTPRRTSAQWALAVLDDYFAALAAAAPRQRGPAAARQRLSRQRLSGQRLSGQAAAIVDVQRGESGPDVIGIGVAELGVERQRCFPA
jgi:AcrR family transcriptional regulator